MRLRVWRCGWAGCRWRCERPAGTLPRLAAGWIRHPAGLEARHHIATALSERGMYEQAEAEFRTLLALREQVLGADHPSTLSTRCNLGVALMGRGRYAQAEAEFRAVRAARERVLGAECGPTPRVRW